LPVEHRERHYARPARLIEAFGETKSISDWAEDPRAVVAANVFLRRIQHGWSAEASITTPISTTRGKREGNAMQYEAFGEQKTLREWALDERCNVSEMTLRKNLHAGMPMEEAFQYRRKPGRHFVGMQEEVSTEVTGVTQALQMMQDDGELWVYTAGEASRISLIHNDIRHTITDEVFQSLLDGEWVVKSFETDTIKNYELSPKAKE
jgi:hypothetical protein